MAQSFSKISVVRKYCEKYPDMPSLRLARMILATEKNLFRDIEQARTSIRAARGRNGEYQRGQYKGTCKHLYKGDEPVSTVPFPKGKTYLADTTPYELKADKALILCDIHAPYHDTQSLEIAVEEARKEKVDAVVINGDGIDFYGLSRFSPDPRKFDAAYELRVFKDVLLAIKSRLRCQIIIKEGNHDERFLKYMISNAPAMLNVELYKFDVLINTDIIDKNAQPSGVDALVIPASRAIRINQLNIIHGHEFSKTMFSPVNPARGLYLRGKECALQGHLHQTSNHTEKTMDGRIISTWSVGCMCNLTPEFARYNNWNHGYAIVDRKKDGFVVHNKKIIGGEIYS